MWTAMFHVSRDQNSELIVTRPLWIANGILWFLVGILTSSSSLPIPTNILAEITRLGACQPRVAHVILGRKRLRDSETIATQAFSHENIFSALMPFVGT